MKRILLYTLLILSFTHNVHAIIVNENFDLKVSRTLAKKNFPNVCQVSVCYNNNKTSYGTGVQISKHAVLTAAHNVPKENRKDTFVSFNSEGTIYDNQREVSSITPHPDSTVDLAILKFNIPIIASEPAQLYKRQVLENQMGYIVGYGTSGNSNGKTAPTECIRHMATTRITSATEQSLTHQFEPLHRSNYGTINTFLTSNETDPYQGILAEGDSGGPLLIKQNDEYLLAGIAFGHTTNSLLGRIATVDDVWTPISPYKRWIKANLFPL